NWSIRCLIFLASRREASSDSFPQPECAASPSLKRHYAGCGPLMTKKACLFQLASEASDLLDKPPWSAAPRRKKVLLGDDNADMRDYVHRLLSNEYDVIEVDNGDAALLAAREYEPDLVLADVMMPALDGFGLVSALRADERLQSIPVVMLSARAGEPDA